MSVVQERVKASDGEAGRLHAVGSLSDGLARLMRVVHTLKTHLTHASGGDLERERAAHLLLFPLVRLGPQRLSALAELVHADPSTVSRHVGLLVKRGLVRRIADEEDGRASRLVVTADGEAVLEEMRQERTQLIEQVTASWAQPDLDVFTELLNRFAQDVEDHMAFRANAGTALSVKKDL